MDEKHLRKLDELWLEGKIARQNHEKKFAYEIQELSKWLDKLNEIPPTDHNHKQTMELSWKVIDLQDKIRREEITDIFPVLEECKAFFRQRRLANSKSKDK